MKAKKTRAAPRPGYPPFPFDVDRGLDVWISALLKYADDNANFAPLRHHAMALSEALYALHGRVIFAHDSGREDPQIPLLVEHARALRLEAEVITVLADLGAADRALHEATAGRIANAEIRRLKLRGYFSGLLEDGEKEPDAVAATAAKFKITAARVCQITKDLRQGRQRK